MLLMISVQVWVSLALLAEPVPTDASLECCVPQTGPVGMTRVLSCGEGLLSGPLIVFSWTRKEPVFSKILLDGHSVECTFLVLLE